MAKGLSSGYLPISATAVSREIVETLRASGEEFTHGYTYSGHPVCAAVALRNLDIIEREDLVGRTARDTGPIWPPPWPSASPPPAGGRGTLARPDRRGGDRGGKGHQPAPRRRREGGRSCATTASRAG
jgi:hypothetical protein